ncbi:pyridoxal phosphate phosphatase PHOSPHO2-like [Saccoglossus kowalevskii]|uniref:Pyridoxal phosphate phosphatase PHOSPHO2-like n=1 Tax=Saccoglossus kowalevskii TaxID=10224 RepID=A0ABM0GX09_SACKO|nr:PREDICTED: pyridoxal phosphate phosphatase PHOSPHO2-like [Saccoglossus kowalevskii]
MISRFVWYHRIQTVSRTLSSMANNNKNLLVFDFDHTLVDGNTDTWILKLLPNAKVPVQIHRHYRMHNSWTDYMAEIMGHMHQLKITPEQIKDCMKEIPFIDGMKDLLMYQAENGSFDCIIVSDSNMVFINTILEATRLEKAVMKVVTNPGHFDDKGCLKIKHYHSHDCDYCPLNLCKREVLWDYIRVQKQGGNGYASVCYVGDGNNDFCPCESLSEKDLVFPRKGFNLLKKITNYQEKGKKFSPKVFPWVTGFEITEKLKTLL